MCNNEFNLPQVSKTHMQEWTSIREFKNIMDDRRFIIREEGKCDYGVDLSLEIILDKKYASNYRINIQMKDKLESVNIKNNDSTYSYQLAITTLCYLLNSPNSIVVLYLEDIDTFVWEWVDYIQKDAEKKGIDFYNTNNSTYTYRFNKILDSKMKEELYKEIILKSEQIRDFNKTKSGIRDIGNSPSDLNISVNFESTKKALKLYLNKMIISNKLEELLLITQYTPKELTHALMEGKMTARLADGIIDILNVDLQVLIGSRKLSVFEENELELLRGDKK